MTDPSRPAGRALRLLLLLAVGALAVGVGLRDRPVGASLRLAGLWIIALTPFVVLLIVSGAARRTRWFAFGTIALVAIGFFLAR